MDWPLIARKSSPNITNVITNAGPSPKEEFNVNH